MNPVLLHSPFTSGKKRQPRFGGVNQHTSLQSDFTNWHDIPSAIKDAFYQKFHDKTYDFTFAGDNFGPVNPNYLEVFTLANSLPHDTYQYGRYGGELGILVNKAFAKTFCDKPDDPMVAAFLPTGTAANRISVSPVLRSIDAIVAADMSHLMTREAAGYMAMNRAAVYPIPHKQGKIDIGALKTFIKDFDWDYQGSSIPKVISITQPTEYGTVYTDDEVKTIARIAHDHGMLLQMDGSRLFYPAANGRSLKSLTTDLGVDIVFMGGSKHKMVQAESVVYTPNFFRHVAVPNLKDPAQFFVELKKYMKQAGVNVGQAAGSQAQFILALENNFGVNLVKNANRKARELEKILMQIPDAKIYLPVETNLVILSMPTDAVEVLKQRYELKIFPEPSPDGPDHTIVRFMTNADTTTQDLAELKKFLTQNNLVKPPRLAFK